MRADWKAALLAQLVLGCTDAQAPAPAPDPRLHDEILFLSDRSGGSQMHLMAPTGGTITPLFPDTNLSGGGVIYTRLSISPDGRWIAFTMLSDVWVMRADGTEPRNLTNQPGADVYPAWSPDGSRIAFASDRDGDYDVYVVHADGTGLLQLTDDPGSDNVPTWRPDGTQIAFVSNRGGDSDIYVMPVVGGDAVNITQNPAADDFPAWSSDGQTIVFVSFRDGSAFLYLMDENGGNVRPLMTDFWALRPSWGPADSMLAFEGGPVNTDIWLVRPDGSGLVNITDSTSMDFAPAWAR